jgi:hypothetical protein
MEGGGKKAVRSFNKVTHFFALRAKSRHSSRIGRLRFFHGSSMKLQLSGKFDRQAYVRTFLAISFNFSNLKLNFQKEFKVLKCLIRKSYLITKSLRGSQNSNSYHPKCGNYSFCAYRSSFSGRPLRPLGGFFAIKKTALIKEGRKKSIPTDLPSILRIR